MQPRQKSPSAPDPGEPHALNASSPAVLLAAAQSRAESLAGAVPVPAGACATHVVADIDAAVAALAPGQPGQPAPPRVVIDLDLDPQIVDAAMSAAAALRPVPEVLRVCMGSGPGSAAVLAETRSDMATYEWIAESLFGDVGRATQNSAAYIGTVLEMIHVLSNRSGARELVDALLDLASKQMGYDYAELFVCDGADDALTAKQSWLQNNPSARRFAEGSGRCSFPILDGLPGHVYRTRDSVWVEDVGSADPRLDFRRAEVARDTGMQSAIMVPAVCGGDVVGVLALFAGGHRALDPLLMRVLALVADHAAANYLRHRGAIGLRQGFERLLESERTFPGLLTIFSRSAEGDQTFEAAFGDLSRHFGMRAEALPGRGAELIERILPDDRARVLGIVERARSEAQGFLIRFRAHTMTGETRWYEARGRVLGLSDLRDTVKWTLFVVDISDDPYAANRSLAVGGTDPETQLPDRDAALQWLGDANTPPAQAQAPPQHTDLVVVALSAMQLPSIGAIYGSRRSVELLQQLAKRCAEFEKVQHVSRIASHALGVIYSNPSGPNGPDDIRDALVGRVIELQTPLTLGTAELAPRVRMGACPARPADDPAVVLDTALNALDEALDTAGDRVVVRDAAAPVAASNDIVLLNALDRAVHSDGIQVFFQPQVDVTSGRIVGAEALVRWHWMDTWVSPGEFVALAERNGLIIPLGRQVIVKALAGWGQLAAHCDAVGQALPKLSVNLSVSQMNDKRLIELAAEHAALAGIAHSGICFEITETVVQNRSRGLRVVRSLRDAGFKVVLDDFGTGYTSLAYLLRLQADTCKVDRLFLQAAAEHAHGRALLADVVKLIANQGMQTIIEGAEHAKHVELLRSAGATIAQGWAYAPALPLDEFIQRFDLACADGLEPSATPEVDPTTQKPLGR